MTDHAIIDQYPAAKFLRCFGAMVYDTFLIAAIQMLVLLIIGQIEGFALDGERLPDLPKLLVHFLVGALFYVWSWTHGGKTLGMTAWRIEVRQFDGRTISTQQAWLRAVTALLGLGNLWKLFDKKNLALHDYLSKTVVVLDKERTLKQD